MRTIITLLFSIYRKGNLINHLSNAEKKLDKIARELDEARAILNSVQDENKHLTKEIEELRSRVKIAEEITIPTLVAQHRLILERTDADVAIEVKRRLANS